MVRHTVWVRGQIFDRADKFKGWSKPSRWARFVTYEDAAKFVDLLKCERTTWQFSILFSGDRPGAWKTTQNEHGF